MHINEFRRDKLDKNLHLATGGPCQGEQMGDSTVVQELKKERLREHLEEVQQLGEEWRGQLSAPSPFSKKFNPKSPIRYKPSLEVDVDMFHMLKRHIKSRALWRNHTEWETNLEKIRDLEEPIGKRTDSIVAEMTRQSPKFEYTRWFAYTALEKVFLKMSRLQSVRKYEPKTGGGLIFGGDMIEETATGESIASVERDHKSLIKELERYSEWKYILVHWRSVKRLEESMRKIVSDTLKSSDFFYPCRFCRKLFKE